MPCTMRGALTSCSSARSTKQTHLVFVICNVAHHPDSTHPVFDVFIDERGERELWFRFLEDGVLPEEDLQSEMNLIW